MATTSGDRIVQTTTKARQGVTGHNVRYVLIFSVLAAIAAMVIIFFLYFK